MVWKELELEVVAAPAAMAEVEEGLVEEEADGFTLIYRRR